MRYVQRGGSVPEERQEVMEFGDDNAAAHIQRMIERYAVRVVTLTTYPDPNSVGRSTVVVVFEEDHRT